LKVII